MTVPVTCVASWGPSTVGAITEDLMFCGEMEVTRVEFALADHHWSIYVIQTPEQIEAQYLDAWSKLVERA